VTARLRAPRLYLITDRQATGGRPLAAVVAQALGGIAGSGLDPGDVAVQLREKDLSGRALTELARELRAVTAAAGAALYVNDRVDVALAVGADAVQRTSTSLPIQDIRAIADKRLRIGVSTHSLEEAVEAELKGADWVVFGPVYETPSKRPYGPPQGLQRLERVAAAVRLPVIAIGGITPDRVRDVLRAGARGVAVISAIIAAQSPADATRRFLDAIDRAA
jgi:thiamine-phosphate pyrophosphorylase